MSDLAKLRIDRSSEERQSSSGILKYVLTGLFIIAILATAYFLYTGPLKPAIEVETATATMVTTSQTSSVLTASGYVVAQKKAEVASKATGRLVALEVEEGSQVKKGQTIGRLESADIEASLARAKADLQLAIATLDEAKTSFKRTEDLVKQDILSQSSYDVEEAKLKRSQAAVESSRAQVRQIEVELENTIIRAPFDGTVLTKNADVGEIVAPFGSAGNSKGSVVSLADMDSLQVEADVSEANIELVKVGGPTEITLDAIPEKRYRGVVHMIVPTADRAKATVLTKIRFVDRDSRVLPEMSAKVTFLTEEISEEEISKKPRLVVSKDAVVERNGKQIVFVMNQDKVEERAVTVTPPEGNLVEVKNGLTSGEQVVLNPPAEMETGTKVKTKE
jgi:RND family efflux transporter MFP subunit